MYDIVQMEICQCFLPVWYLSFEIILLLCSFTDNQLSKMGKIKIKWFGGEESVPTRLTNTTYRLITLNWLYPTNTPETDQF